MHIEQLNDPNDARVSNFRKLNDASFRRTIESGGPFRPGILTVEGWLSVERLIGSRFETQSVLVVDTKIDRAIELFAKRDVVLYQASRDVIAEVVGFDLHRGIVATATRGRMVSYRSVIARSRRLVLCEGVNDATNMGSLIRNAAALGADALLLDSTSCDHLTRRAIRVSMGYALTLPVARASTVDLLASLADNDVGIAALTPREDADKLTDLSAEQLTIKPDGPLCIALGAEGPGLTDALLDSAQHRVRIPMADGVDSLNVATAAAVAMSSLFEVRNR